MLMLEYKGIDYRLVTLRTGLHPMLVRMRGFPGHRKPIRSLDGGATPGSLALLDRLGTVPALRFQGERVQTNRAIARFLDRVQPEPPLFPADPERRSAVEEAERWGDQRLQMAARRIGLAAGARGLDNFHARANSGRLGPLLARGDTERVLAARISARIAFRASPEAERELVAELPAMLDRIDAWIEHGVLDGEQPNAADFVIVPCLALLAYVRELRPSIEARPAGALLERLLPEPSPVT